MKYIVYLPWDFGLHSHLTVRIMTYALADSAIVSLLTCTTPSEFAKLKWRQVHDAEINKNMSGCLYLGNSNI